MADELTTYGNDRCQVWENVIDDWARRLNSRAEYALSFHDKNELCSLIIEHMDRVREFGFDDRKETPQNPPPTEVSDDE